MFIYFYDNPELIHAVLEKLSEGWLGKIKFLEKNNELIMKDNHTLGNNPENLKKRGDR